MSVEHPKKTEPVSQDDQLPVSDLAAQPVDAESAEQVRGGATSTGKVSTHDITIMKPVDKASP